MALIHLHVFKSSGTSSSCKLQELEGRSLEPCFVMRCIWTVFQSLGSYQQGQIGHEHLRIGRGSVARTKSNFIPDMIMGF